MAYFLIGKYISLFFSLSVFNDACGSKHYTREHNSIAAIGNKKDESNNIREKAGRKALQHDKDFIGTGKTGPNITHNSIIILENNLDKPKLKLWKSMRNIHKMKNQKSVTKIFMQTSVEFCKESQST